MKNVLTKKAGKKYSKDITEFCQIVGIVDFLWNITTTLVTNAIWGFAMSVDFTEWIFFEILKKTTSLKKLKWLF